MVEVKVPDPTGTLVEMQAMVESDLMKARHFLKLCVKVAIICDQKDKAIQFSQLYKEVDDLLSNFSGLLKK